MNVFLAGATGVLGRRLTRLLIDHGHNVVALARSPEKAATLEEQGAVPQEVDLFNPGQLARAADGCDVVVHAATSIPTRTRTTPRDWTRNDRLRREGTAALTDCAAKIGARAYVHQSVVWVARPQDGTAFDEQSPPPTDPLMRATSDGERMALDAGGRHGFDTSVLRCGWFYSADSTHTQMLGHGLRKRQVPVVGRGDALWACLHVDDAATAFLSAIERPQTGVWHVVDDSPVTVRDFLTTFAEMLKARTPRRVPVWLARLLVGRLATEFFTMSTRTSNTAFCRDFSWKPQYPDYRDGLRQVIAEWSVESPASPGFTTGS